MATIPNPAPLPRGPPRDPYAARKKQNKTIGLYVASFVRPSHTTSPPEYASNPTDRIRRRGNIRRRPPLPRLLRRNRLLRHSTHRPGLLALRSRTPASSERSETYQSPFQRGYELGITVELHTAAEIREGVARGDGVGVLYGEE